MVLLNILESWSSPVFQCNLQNLDNVKLIKVSEDQFVLMAIQLKLYSIQKASQGPAGLEKTVYKLKQVQEILAWDLNTAQKHILIDHQTNRTELLLANQGKNCGITHILVQWKAKQIKTVNTYL